MGKWGSERVEQWAYAAISIWGKMSIWTMGIGAMSIWSHGQMRQWVWGHEQMRQWAWGNGYGKKYLRHIYRCLIAQYSDWLRSRFYCMPIAPYAHFPMCPLLHLCPLPHMLIALHALFPIRLLPHMSRGWYAHSAICTFLIWSVNKRSIFALRSLLLLT